jgi:hypothetical protein
MVELRSRFPKGDLERGIAGSKSCDLFRFDFRSGGPFPRARAAVPVSTSGGASIAQWLRFEIDDEDGMKTYRQWVPSRPLVRCSIL